ncbi:MAG: 2-hydroxyacid dehydrogenase [Planctomycetaceae bacterium]|jgi:D-lactate dehydrogenase|nr:2-hydroxyacid dehydrogenase [Planctomycetaceae bacterium]
MKTAVFSTKPYDRKYLIDSNQHFGHELVFYEAHLNDQTCRLTEGFQAVCVFVNDELNDKVLNCLAKHGCRMIALRCAGFNNVDLLTAKNLGITVARVPAYSPASISEFTLGLILTLSRHIHRACNRTREGNFALDGLLGFDLYGKTAGVFGTGKIGAGTAKILLGFGCHVLASDLYENNELKTLGVQYVSRDELFQKSDIITLHCPLLPDTRHLINTETITKMKHGVMIVNTSRGELLDTDAAIFGLKSGKIGSLAIDVYEEEAEVFFEDFSSRVIQDDTLARILTFPNAIVTGHQAFFTIEAMQAIAQQTLQNIAAFEQGQTPPGLVHWENKNVTTK